MSTPLLRRPAILIAAILLVALVSATITLGVIALFPADRDPHETGGGNSAQATRSIPRGPRGAAASVITVPSSENATLVLYELRVLPTALASSEGALVNVRLRCSAASTTIKPITDGLTSTNVTLSQGGSLSGQALIPPHAAEARCSLLVTAPVAASASPVTALPVTADVRIHEPALEHVANPVRLKDATRIDVGSNRSVLIAPVADLRRLREFFTTVRLTSCTVEGGSRDAGGELQCTPTNVTPAASTVRMRVLLRRLDSSGAITSTALLWDQTVSVSPTDHHVPETIRLQQLQQRTGGAGGRATIAVIVESVAGSPVVVHGEGTSGIVGLS